MIVAIKGDQPNPMSLLVKVMPEDIAQAKIYSDKKAQDQPLKQYTGKATSGNINALVRESFDRNDVIFALNETMNDVMDAREMLAVSLLGLLM